MLRTTSRLWYLALAGVCLPLTLLSVGLFVGGWTRVLPPRAELEVVEGALIGAPLERDVLFVQLEGYAPKAALVHGPTHALHAELAEASGTPVRMRVAPSVPTEVQLVELELLDHGTPRLLLSYAKAERAYAQDNLAMFLGAAFFGLILLAVLVGFAGTRAPRPRAQPREAGRITQDFFLRRSNVLALHLATLAFALAYGALTLLPQSENTLPKDDDWLIPLGFAISSLCALYLTALLLRRRPWLSANDGGLALRGGPRIPWEQISHARLKECKLELHLRSPNRANRPKQVGLGLLDATRDELEAVFCSRGLSVTS